MAPQSGAKDQFYCTVYYTSLNSNCEAQRVSKKLQKIELEAKINAWLIFVYFLLFNEKIILIGHYILKRVSWFKKVYYRSIYRYTKLIRYRITK